MTNTFRRGLMLTSSVWNLYRMRDRILMNPVYQREGEVWNIDKKQMLIDTILNGFDVPKIYLHKISNNSYQNFPSFEYAVVDGKQRLTTLWSFIEGGFSLQDEFSYLADDSIKLSGLKYSDLAKQYPDIKSDLDSYQLQIIEIETDDTELIEDMFSRLNEAVPLNAAEKRNAKPGPLPGAVRKLSSHAFFLQKIPFTNKRYRHFDLAAKMILFASRDAIADTKKAYIDEFFKINSTSESEPKVATYTDKCNSILNCMTNVFDDKDQLLKSVGMISLYFLIFERAIERKIVHAISRSSFVEFERSRQDNRAQAERDIPSASYRLLEFDRFTQSPNDGIALRYRLEVFDSLVFGGQLGFSRAD